MSITPIINHLINYFSNNSINVIEIGARYGESSKLLLKYLNINKYIIIDPYTSYNEYKDDGFNKIISNDSDDKIFNKVNIELKNIHNNIIFYRTFSNDITTINSIKNESIDLIFIDGNHTYNYVLQDLENYYPKLNKSGILCGDDFFMRMHKNDVLNTMPGNEGYDEPMVYEAVIEFCKRYNKTFEEFGKHRGYGKTFMINN